MTSINVLKSRIFNDLVEYTKLHPKLVLERCKYSTIELAILWNKRKSNDDYYKSNDLYLYDLTRYQMRLEAGNLQAQMIEQLKEIKAKKVLEFGGGIGEFSLFSSKAGFDISYFDLDGVIKEYALWRFKKHGADVKIAKDPLDEEWDCINIMDVLEHVEKPEEIIALLRQRTKFIFCNPEYIRYNLFFPQHISRFELSGFKKIKGYLWKNQSFP